MYGSGENGEIYLGEGGNMLAHNLKKDQGCYVFLHILLYLYVYCISWKFQ